MAEPEAGAEAQISAILFGHERARGFLQAQLAAGRLHHALLLEGRQGIGKASLAFHLAYRIISAPQGDAAAAAKAADFWPDAAEADSADWRKMAQGAHPGLLYISRGYDPKTKKRRSAVGVEDIRRISRFLQQTAADKGWRIVIIDSADDMNRNAANALLKTLEEPPPRSLFMLVSHNAGRLLPTIRSRCQSVRLQPLAESEQRALAAHIREQGGAAEAANETSAAAQAEELLSLPVFPVPRAQALAESLARRDSEADYERFWDGLLELIAQKSRAAAEAGALARASALAEFYQKQEQAMQEAAAFNLDKKQFMLVALQQSHHILRRHNAT